MLPLLADQDPVARRRGAGPPGAGDRRAGAAGRGRRCRPWPAARASALLAQGDAKAAAAILARAPGIDRSPELAHAAAETALLAGDDARACSVAEGLSSGRDEIYWLRLRTYCQAIAGHADQAQLTFDLAQAQAKDPVFGRLMAAKLAGAGNPGAASLRNGLDYALSRSLGLDLGAAKASPEVAAALVRRAGRRSRCSTPPPRRADVAPLVEPLDEGPAGAAMRLVQALVEAAGGDRAEGPCARARPRRVWRWRCPAAAERRARAATIAALSAPEGKAPVGRNLALDAAADQKLMGEAALLALWTCAEAGAGGVAMGDRIRIVRALHAVGLEARRARLRPRRPDRR